MKMHLHRSDRSTWCGREIIHSGFSSRFGIIPPDKVTHSCYDTTCKTCLKADAAEQRKEDAASE